MTVTATALLYGTAASIAAVRLSSARLRLPRRDLSVARQNTLVDAMGRVAGTPEKMRAVARQQLMATIVAVFLMTAVVASQPRLMNVLAAGAVVLGSRQVPLLTARSREKARRRAFDLELTDSLGEMVMGVEAGLTLEAVMNLYARRHDSPLGREFRVMIDRINLGTPRTVALQEFAERTPTLEAQTFVSALQQNHKLGTPLAEVLRQQGASSRRRRRQAVEEAAAKLSLKMIFPTVFCILPVLMVVVVGPAVVRLVHSLPG